MALYTEYFEVSSHDVAANGIARPSAVLRYFQEAANHQMRDCRPSYLELMQQGKSFLLSRIALVNPVPLRQYDKIEVQTWPCETRGSSFPRSYRMLRDGKEVARAHAIWALLDVQSGKLLRVGDVDLSAYEHEQPIELEGVRFAVPKQGMTPVLQHTVSYAECDFNRHMNNTNYPDMLLDGVPEIERGWLREFALHFVSEAPLHERLSISRCGGARDEHSAEYFFTSEKQSGVNINARVLVRFE